MLMVGIVCLAAAMVVSFGIVDINKTDKAYLAKNSGILENVACICYNSDS